MRHLQRPAEYFKDHAETSKTPCEVVKDHVKLFTTLQSCPKTMQRLFKEHANYNRACKGCSKTMQSCFKDHAKLFKDHARGVQRHHAKLFKDHAKCVQKRCKVVQRPCKVVQRSIVRLRKWTPPINNIISGGVQLTTEDNKSKSWYLQKSLSELTVRLFHFKESRN